MTGGVRWRLVSSGATGPGAVSAMLPGGAEDPARPLLRAVRLAAAAPLARVLPGAVVGLGHGASAASSARVSAHATVLAGLRRRACPRRRAGVRALRGGALLRDGALLGGFRPCQGLLAAASAARQNAESTQRQEGARRAGRGVRAQGALLRLSGQRRPRRAGYRPSDRWRPAPARL